MCGLTGIFEQDRRRPVDERILRRMTQSVAHRGPDGDGFHVEPGLGLGHRRLSVIDVVSGHQPMFNEDQSVVIIFNGEIYNHTELRPKLQALGHVFSTRGSDTETIVHAWEEYGTACLDQLNGQFAFALWDRNRQVLFLARDRLGKKPMYYARSASGALVFASEMSAMACVTDLARHVDPRAVDDFFAYGYVPDPGSIYTGVHKLPAGHYLLVDRSGAADRPVRYWGAPSDTRPISETDAVAELTERLTRAVEYRLIADVPVGAFLSGGVDSSAIVATAARVKTSPLSTFTIGFEGAEDETRFAEMMAGRYATAQHNERAVADDPIEAARDQGRIFGEPFGDSSAVPTRRVSALARRHVTVALSGDGGDELFGGYRRHRFHVMTEGIRRHIPAGMRRRVLGGLAAVYPKLDRAPRFLRAKHTLTELSLDSALGYYRMMAHMHQAQRRALFSPAIASQLDGYDPGARIAALMASCETDDALIQAQFVDVNTYLVGDILTKVDRASMAVSLEARAPFLDHNLVEWAMRLPAALKLSGPAMGRPIGKHVLKKAMEPFVPREILYRPKQGFATSPAALFRRDAGRLRDRLLGPQMLDSGLFRPETLAALVNEHERGDRNHSAALWNLLVFEGFLHSEAPIVSASAERESVTA